MAKASLSFHSSGHNLAFFVQALLRPNRVPRISALSATFCRKNSNKGLVLHSGY